MTPLYIGGGMTPQTTPRYARGYIYSLWGSLGWLKYGRKISPYFFSVFICKIIKDFYKKVLSTPVILL